jgi:hypothetical protein
MYAGAQKASLRRDTMDRMPGEEKAGDTVARACAEGLDVLMAK